MKRIVVGIVAVAMLVVVVGFVAGRYVTFSTRQWPPQRQGGRLLGVIEGAVKRLDQSAGVIDVASGRLGLGVLRLVISPETTVTVGEKLGWLSNLERDRFVRVTYEVQAGRLFAWRVDVVPGRAHASEVDVRHLIADVATASAAVVTLRGDAAVASPGEVAPTPAISAEAGRAPARVGAPTAARVADTPIRPHPTRPSSTQAASPRSPARLAAVPPPAGPPPAAPPPVPASAGPAAPAPPEIGVVIEPDLSFPPVAYPGAQNMPPAVATPTGSGRAAERFSRALEKILVMPPPAARSREPASTRAPQLP